jgi:hypothetical protein
VRPCQCWRVRRSPSITLLKTYDGQVVILNVVEHSNPRCLALFEIKCWSWTGAIEQN